MKFSIVRFYGAMLILAFVLIYPSSTAIAQDEILNGNLSVGGKYGSYFASPNSENHIDLGTNSTHAVRMRMRTHSTDSAYHTTGISFWQWKSGDPTDAEDAFLGLAYSAGAQKKFVLPGIKANVTSAAVNPEHVAIGMNAEPSSFNLEIDGDVHAACGFYDGTPWPRKSPEQALDDLLKIKGTFVDLNGDGKYFTSVLDHSSMPKEIRKTTSYVISKKGDEKTFQKYARRHEMEIVDEMNTSTLVDDKTGSDTTFTTARVRNQSRDIGGTLSFCILGIQAEKKLIDNNTARIASLETIKDYIQVTKSNSNQSGVTIGGTLNNIANGNNVSICGIANDIEGSNSLVLSGSGNQLAGNGNIVIGGDANEVNGSNNLIHGSKVSCESNGNIVLGSNYTLTPSMTNSLVLGDAASGSCNLGESNCVYMFPDAPDGKVAIGAMTVEKGTKLKVGGGDLRVSDGALIVNGKDMSVPDYVFEPNHKLMSISELRNYIQQHRKLPNVPSADDIKSNGINVSEFQLILLERVEELSLYIIKQDQQIEQQKTQIEHQAKLIQELKAEVHKR